MEKSNSNARIDGITDKQCAHNLFEMYMCCMNIK